MGNIAWNFENKVVVITGAAAGIGKGTALAFAKAGASVAICDIDEAAGVAAAKECLAAGSPKANFYRLDVQKDEEVTAARDAIVADFGTVDFLFSNAGIFPKDMGSSLESVPDGVWDRVFEINFFGAVRVCRAFTPIFKAKKSGKIVITSSISLNRPNPNNMPYCSSKVAVASLAQSLALELGAYNANVNVICPGFVFTNIYANGGGMYIKEKRGGFENCKDDEAVMNALAAGSALGRPQTVQDIANSVMFLCSEEASEITGQILNVDSGIVFRY